MMAAQDASIKLVGATPGIRFGLATFNNGNGGHVIAPNGTNSTQLSFDIQSLSAGGSTPLAETMYELSRYFRGMRAFYSPSTFTSPIQYRCQKNYIVVLTDGLPSSDTDFPPNNADPDVDISCPLGFGSCSLPDWDGLGVNGVGGIYFDDPAPTLNASAYFDDLVKFAYDVDMRRAPSTPGASGGALDGDGMSFDSEPFVKQNVQTYVVGFSIDNLRLREAAHYGSGLTASEPFASPATHYFTTNDEAQLLFDLQAILTSIQSQQ